MRGRVLGGSSPISRLGVPIGGVDLPGTTRFFDVDPGPGWLAAKGQSISKATYPTLHATLPLGHPLPARLTLPGANTQGRCAQLFKGSVYQFMASATLFRSVSADLTSWVAVANVGNGTNGVAASVNTMMTAGANGVLYWTTDGATYNSVNLNTSFAAFRVAFGAGVFVAGGAGGFGWTAEQSFSLTAISTATGAVTSLGAISNGRGTVEYVNGRFVISNVDGYIFTSTDGKTWTYTGGKPSTAGFSRIFFMNGKYVGVGSQGGVNAIFTSTDLISWVTVYTPPNDFAIGYNAGCDGTCVVIPHYNGAGTSTRFAISYNLVDWFSLLTASGTSSADVLHAADIINGRILLLSNSSGVFYVGAMPGPDDDRVLPAISLRTPAWIKAA